MQKEVFIVSAVRTATGSFGGSLRNVKATDLAAAAIRGAIAKAGIQPSAVDEVIMGECRQSTEAANMARLAALLGGVPESVPAFTVQRNCASAMQALKSGYQQILLGECDVVIAGGAENMSRAPYLIRNARFGEGILEFGDSNLEGGPNSQPVSMYGKELNMGMTAENVAAEFGIGREEQDAFALESQRRTARSQAEGRFADEIIPFEIKTRKGVTVFEKDEYPKPETTIEILQKLRPAFKADGSVTAGNACGRNDGASAVVLMSGEKVRELGIKPMGKVIGVATAALSPKIMGYGPVPAVKKLLAATGLKIEDIDLTELNEAFAALALAVVKDLGLELAKVNVNGGAIALGHALGSTGTRLITTLLHELGKRKARYGLATLCIGGGQGMATIVENLRR